MELVARGNLEDDNVRGFFLPYLRYMPDSRKMISAALGVQFEV